MCAACGIKDARALGLFGNIGRLPTTQSALLDNFKSDAESRLGYFCSFSTKKQPLKRLLGNKTRFPDFRCAFGHKPVSGA